MTPTFHVCDEPGQKHTASIQSSNKSTGDANCIKNGTAWDLQEMAPNAGSMPQGCTEAVHLDWQLQHPRVCG